MFPRGLKPHGNRTECKGNKDDRDNWMDSFRTDRRADCQSHHARKRSGGVIITILLGIAGSLIGGFVGQALFGYGRAANDTGDLTRPGFLMSLVLAVVGPSYC